eukprot:COSAG06_NODE_4553_length_4153_cov_321.455599_4_plen_179_part_00
MHTQKTASLGAHCFALQCSASPPPPCSLSCVCAPRVWPPLALSLVAFSHNSTHIIITRMCCFSCGGIRRRRRRNRPACRCWLALLLQLRGHARPGPPGYTRRTRQPGAHPEEPRRGAARGGGAPGGARGQDRAAGKRPRIYVDHDGVPRCASCCGLLCQTGWLCVSSFLPCWVPALLL